MKLGKKRIHIAPVGFEIDRVVIPAVDNKADKVFLLVHNNKKNLLGLETMVVGVGRCFPA